MNKPLTLATFNIEWFWKKGYEKDYPMLFREIRHCDVIGVQEITDLVLFQKVVGKYLGKNWGFVASDYPTQKIGLLYDEDVVEPQRFEEYDAVSLGQKQGRPGFLGGFVHRETGLGFDVMVVHLKSGSRQKDVNTRKAQWEALTGIIKNHEAESGNMVLLGDMNCFDRNGERLTELRAFTLATGFVLVTDGDNYTETEKYGDRIDHILASPAFAPRLERVSVGGACSPDRKNREEDRNAYWEKVSDHCPVIAMFNI